MTAPKIQGIERARIPTALNFDALPDSARVGIPTVQMLFGISTPTVFRWIKSGKLPQPIRESSRCTRFRVGDLRRVLAGAA